MQRRILAQLVVGAVLALTLALGSASASAGRPDVPIKGGIVSTSFEPAPATAARCPTLGADAEIVSSFAGVGRLSHLGRVTWSSSHCVDLDTGQYNDGRMTIVAANGDELKAEYAGWTLGGPPVAPITDELVFVDGGTGRFAHASGGATEVGTFDFTTGTVDLDWEGGTIAYGR